VSPRRSGRPAPLAALTTRGRCLLGLCPVLAVSAWVFGEPDLLRLAVLLLVLPLVCSLAVVRTRYGLSCTRSLEPAAVQVGGETGVRLELRNVSRLPSGVLLMEDTLPYALGGRPRFVLDRVEPGGLREVVYRVRPSARGRFPLGPLAVRLTDPFGLCELQRSFTSVDSLLVTPAVIPLPPVRLGGDRGGSGDTPSAALATGTDDVTTREYRRGDDLRKVHWRSTARVGELMVRQEEQPRRNRATLLLDGRRAAHRGDGPTSSYECAVSATASIGINLVRGGFAVTLESDGIPLLPPGAQVSEAVLLGALADVSPSDHTTFATVAERVAHAQPGAALIAVLGQLSPEEAQRLARVGAPGRLAVLLDVPSWESSPASPAAGADVLRAAGWRVAELSSGDDLAAAWLSLGAQQVSA
jgi:uncharacterized protein (DUF58 family)